MRADCHRRAGQSLVELALSLPLLLLLLYGLAEFGFLLYGHVQVANATREAARAGSLYLGSRFHYTASKGGDDCWSLAAWVENALVERNRAQNGCPLPTSNPAIHSFGLLSPARCQNINELNCWMLQPMTIDGLAITDTPAWIGTHAGDALQVEVQYRYELPLLGGVFQINPVMIQKTVIMRMQNN
jgi:hypothetical protein